MMVGHCNKHLKEKDKMLRNILQEFKVGLIHSLKTFVGHIKPGSHLCDKHNTLHTAAEPAVRAAVKN